MDQVREFLESAKWARVKALRLARKINQLASQVEHIVPSYSGMPSGGSGDVTAAWTSFVQLREDYIREKARAERIEKEVSEFVESLPSPECREILQLRYCLGLKWPEVNEQLRASGLYYTERSIYRLHGKALNEAREKWREINYDEI